MPSAEGNVVQNPNTKTWYARVPIGGGKRRSFPLEWATTRAEATERAAFMVAVSSELRALDDADTLSLLPALLVRAAGATDAKALPTIREAVDRLTSGKTSALKKRTTIGHTFADVANAWTSGELAKKYPDHVRKKRSAANDAQRLRDFVLPALEGVAMRSFTIDHADRVMGGLPELSSATRRQIAQVMHRVCALAVYPLRLIERSPLPKGWLPKIGHQPKQAMPYPPELDAFCACKSEPLYLRFFVGFLAREGMRHDEAESLTWADVDLKNGLVALDENKTDAPRGWDLRPSTLRALRAWFEMKGKPDRSTHVFVDDDGERLRLRPEDYRDALQRTGVARPELFEEKHAKGGGLIRKVTAFHALRALFITEAFMRNESERWAMRRSGHTTSSMLSRYNDVAASLSATGMAPLGDLDAILGMVVLPQKTLVPPGGKRVLDKQKARSKHRSPRRGSTRQALKSAAARRVGSTPTGATSFRRARAVDVQPIA